LLLAPAPILRGVFLISAARVVALWISLFLLVVAHPVYVSAQTDTENTAETAPISVESRRLQARMAETHQNITAQKKNLLLQEHQLQSLKKAIDESLKEMDLKLTQIKTEQARLEFLLAQKQSEETKQLRQLSKIYENMVPAKAAQAISELDQQLAASLLSLMRPRAAGKILDNLNEDQATALSLILISQQSP
jgi:flagellar motility protein MotE (MotC chaperone)